MRTVELEIADMHERHPGLTAAVASYYMEGASVCLNRHHESPKACQIIIGTTQSSGTVSWHVPTAAVVSAWANADDATRDGAYALSLASVEAAEGLVAVGRAETRTGADYYVAPKGTATGSFENSFRLEISGIDRGEKALIDQRLRQKQEQARAGQSNLPAIAAVVGFKLAVISIAYVVK